MSTAIKPREGSVAGATVALVLLTAMNFVNYLDRYILPAVQEQVKSDFHLTDNQLGSLTLWFFAAYVASAPFTGWLGDKFKRKPMIVIAALVIAGMNFFTASVHDYMSLNLRHMALGVGEASFGIFAPALLADFYSETRRNAALTIFNVAIPVGAALGYLAGGNIAEHHGWRMAFVASAVPGALIALLILFFMREPERTGAHEKAQVDKGSVLSLLTNKAYLAAILGYAAVTFSLGGISFWMPAFLQRFDGREIGAAGTIMGGITVVCGLGSTLIGGAVANWWSKKTGKALYYMPGIGAALAAPPALMCFFGPTKLILPMLALAVFFIFLGAGPVNAATLNAVPSNLRATAMAGQLFALHVFGDLPSSKIIGMISDRTNLRLGLGVTLVTMLVAAVIFIVGARWAPKLHNTIEAHRRRMNAAFWPSVVEIAAWAVALGWCAKTTDALRNLPLVPNLTGLEWDVWPEGLPGLTVIVPARDEAANIAATLDTLMQQDYTNLRVVAVDDRSTDETGAIMDRFAERFPERVTVVHVTELPEGWLGKVHAMAVGFAMCETEYVLFTDGDVLFSPSVLRRALAYVEQERADHFVAVPTMQVKSWGEGVLLGFFQVLSLWVSRPWRASDPEAERDAVGIGAFNLLRRDALERLGGFEPQRLVVLEDMTLARRAKAAGMRQRVAFAPGLVLVHWAAGVKGLMGVMSKNLFSAFNFRPVLALGACVWIAVFCIAPLAGIFWWGTIVPGLLVAACVSVGYRMYGELSWIEARAGWGFPLGAVMFIYAVVRSVVVVWKDGGVKWRGTLYPLRELRRWNSPRRWKKKG